MRNLNPSLLENFAIFRNAVSQKREPSKALLEISLDSLERRYEIYDELYNSNYLETLEVDPAHDRIKHELKSLYSYNNASIKLIKNDIENNQPRTIRRVCQYCTLESIGEMDHVVGHSEFPEFGIHPKNLIPSCSTCNRLKGKYWRRNGERTILNLYLDVLPVDRYLFLTVKFDEEGSIDFEFILENRTEISDIKWNLIERHYKKLQLLKRMRNKAISHLTGLQHEIRVYSKLGITREDHIEIIYEKGSGIRREFGNNYWQAVLEEGLIDSDIFWNSV